MSDLKYPYSRPSITEEDIAAVTRVLTSGALLSQGPEIEAFEAELAAQVGCRHAVVCNSGTAALHLAYLALEVKEGARIVTSPITFLATANAAALCGAGVSFCDVEEATGNMSPDALEAALAEPCDGPTVIVPIHLAGRPADMTRIHAIARRYGARVVEDASHALGAFYTDAAGQRHSIGGCGHSDITAFSFHAIKNIGMGEGGACCTNDAELAARMRLFRNHGLTRDPAAWQNAPSEEAPWYYEMQMPGWNYRASDILCALGRSQLARLETALSARERIAATYAERLGGLNHVTLPQPPDTGSRHGWHLFPISVDFEGIGRSRSDVMNTLRAAGIGTQVHYIPLHLQPYYQRADRAPLPKAETYYARTLSIPLYPGLTDDDIDFICARLREALSPARGS